MLELSGDVLAVFQVLERLGPLGTSVARLNRGPVWLRSETEEMVALDCVALITRAYPLRLGRLLFLAPNVEMTESAVSGLDALGLRRRWSRPWNSSWVHVQRPDAELRAALDGKWRNQLGSAERRGLEVTVDSTEATFEWLLDRHQEFSTEREFRGPSREFLRSLREESLRCGEAFLVLQALVAAQPVAAIAVACHGTSATFLVGWSGHEGRRAHASNLLLWLAVRELRARGAGWFDLGGLNEYGTPGITAFKRGLGGSEYRLVGEYVTGRLG
jgi:hypothetical protein